MRRYSANYIFPVTQQPIKNGIVEVDDNGKVLNIIIPNEEFREIHSTEFHNGVIVPGFVNAHCHIELSHLKDQLPRGLGLPGFIKAVAEHRTNDSSVIFKSICDSIKELEFTGTVAVGDICNTTDTLNFKLSSKINFYNFIEVFGINPSKSDFVISAANIIKDSFESSYNGFTSITPHSTYSLSNVLWEKLSKEIEKTDSSVTIHYGESMAEYEFLSKGTGLLLERYNALGVPFDVPMGLSPKHMVMTRIPKNAEVLFVHNTFAAIDELLELSKFFRKATFVTCPESNLIIEGQLPNLSAMAQSGLRIAIGTDSLASATTLSMLYHINLLLNNYPNITFAEILKWATLNGAEALQFAHKFGSIDIGKTPGLNLITHFDFNNMRPTANSTVKRLV